MATATKSPPTSTEVARRAGVSRTTVSFVLNDVRDQGISDSTRAKVLAAARDMGYQPNAAARTLAGGSTGTVALVIPKGSHLYVDVFLAQLAASINEECHRYGLRMLIESTEDDGREPGGFVQPGAQPAHRRADRREPADLGLRAPGAHPGRRHPDGRAGRRQDRHGALPDRSATTPCCRPRSRSII